MGRVNGRQERLKLFYINFEALLRYTFVSLDKVVRIKAEIGFIMLANHLAIK